MLNTLKFKQVLLTFFLVCAVLPVLRYNSTFAQSHQPPNSLPDEKINLDPNTVLNTLDKNHPRLMLKDKDLENLRQQYEKDELLQKYIKEVIDSADRHCEEPTLTYRKEGIRLLEVSRDCLRRISTLGIAYRWTGEEKYAKKAAEELLAVCDFNDWNPSHFLDTAEMSHAVGLGYDWFYSYFDEGTRQKIRAGLIKNGLIPGINAYSGEGLSWTKNKYNWNIVCNNGLIIGALAVAETDPNYAKFIIPKAAESMTKALHSYSPEGVWPEGLMYWEYATRYLAYGLSSLDSALGKDFGLSQFPGLQSTGLFYIYLAGPTGRGLNFGDIGSRNHRRPTPCMFWLARKFNNQFIADDEHNTIARSQDHRRRVSGDEHNTTARSRGRRYHFAQPHHIMWYVPPSQNTSQAKDLDRFFQGDVSVAVFRSSWDDPNALFAGIKAGYNQVGHGHLDLGSFELDALGIRWAKDLGDDNYDLAGYWDKGKGGKRWIYYRTGSASHNVPLINNQNQNELAKVKFVKFESKKSSAFAVIDLTDAYEEFAANVTRGLAIIGNRRAVVVQDEFKLKKPCEIAWAMTTDADIKISRNNVAELNLDGEKLVAKLISPANAGFSVESAEQKPPQKSNEGTNRLMIRLPDAKGNVRIAVLLSPVWPDGKGVKKVKLEPLEKWK